MARRPTVRERAEEAAKRMEPRVRAAFLASIDDLVNNVRLDAFIQAIERGDVAEALRVLDIDQVAYAPLSNAIRDAYLEGGAVGAASMTGLKPPGGVPPLVIRFDARNPRAERWLADRAGGQIVEIARSQQIAVQEALFDGLSRGLNPRATALGIVGRVNQATGKREGGIIGLTSQEAGFVRNARDQLGGDAAALREYLTRTRRDKRFDPIVKRAIRDDAPLKAADIDKITGRYADRLLKTRADRIARTETFAAIESGKREAYQQAIDAGKIEAGAVRRVWRSAGDARVRDSHAALDGESVGFNEAFSNGLLYPNDPAGPPEEVINCRCIVEERIDFARNVI